MKRFAVEMFLAFTVIALSGDLLYLWVAGGWREPNRVIEVSKLVMFVLLVALGIAYAIWRWQEMGRTIKWKNAEKRAEIKADWEISHGQFVEFSNMEDLLTDLHTGKATQIRGVK